MARVDLRGPALPRRHTGSGSDGRARLTMWGASQLLTTYFTMGTTAATLQLLLGPGGELIPPDPYMSQRLGARTSQPSSTTPGSRSPTTPGELGQRLRAPGDATTCYLRSTISTFITAVSDWGQISYWALCDAQVEGGNNFIVGTLENPILVSAGDQVEHLGPRRPQLVSALVRSTWSTEQA